MMDRWTPVPVQRAREVRQQLRLNTYPVDTASYAIDFFMGKPLPSNGQPVLRSAWARDGSARPEIHLIEESQQFEKLGLVLTLLTIDNGDLIDDDDEDESNLRV